MNKRVFVVAALGVAAVLVAGGLVASNMGFKANYAMDGPGANGSATGTNTLGLPYNQQTSINNALDLILDIAADNGDVGNLLPTVASVSRKVRTTDLPDIYTGFSGNNFAITPGEGYLVVIAPTASPATVPYIIVGSHDPSLAIVLDGPGDNGSATGTQQWSYPYHSTASTALELITEINAASVSGDAVASVSRKVRGTDLPDIYTGFSGNNFSLTPGEAYLIVIKSGNATTYVPSHY